MYKVNKDGIMTTVLKYKNVIHHRINRIDKNNKSDPWEDMCDTPSEVGVEGKLVVDETLRKSCSIRNAYEFDYIPEEMNLLFKEFYIGAGSKHVYKQGDFMKEHYDSRLPPLVRKRFNNTTKKSDPIEFPHIMTMLVIKTNGYTGGELYVDGKELVTSDMYAYRDVFTVVAFSLNASHEVKPVLDGIRMSFAFPIYGEYNPIESIKHCVKNTEVYSIRDFVLNKLKETPKDEDDPSTYRAKLQGYVEALDDSKARYLIGRYRKYFGDYIPYNGDIDGDDYNLLIDKKTAVSYTLEGKDYSTYVVDEFTVPDGATNIKIVIDNIPDRLLKEVIDHVASLQDYSQEPTRGYNTVYPEGSGIPKNPFTVVLTGRYFKDSTIADLTTDDRAVYDIIKATGRTFEFVPTANFDSRYICYVSYDKNKFVTTIPRSSRVSHIHVEFDDQGAYNPEFILVYGMLIVE